MGKSTRKKPASRPTRRPVQARGIATFEALLEAAARILSKEDFDRFTTNRIAKVAGVGIGSFYEYFSDKHAKIEAQAIESIRAQEGVEIGQAVAGSLHAAIEIFRAREDLNGRLIAQAALLPGTNPLSLIERPITAALADMLRSHADEIIVEDFEVAAITFGRICRSMVESAMADPFMPLDLAAAEAELILVCRRYLTGRP